LCTRKTRLGGVAFGCLEKGRNSLVAAAAGASPESVKKGVWKGDRGHILESNVWTPQIRDLRGGKKAGKGGPYNSS